MNATDSTTAAPIPAAAAGATVGVHSEVGTLRRVLLHRPGAELNRLTPRNKDALLFDEVLWARRARQEHDAFADLLADRGVEVLYLHELLASALDVPEGRATVLDRSLAPLGAALAAETDAWLGGLDSEALTRLLLGGITFGELPFARRSLAALAGADDDFVLAPLPNHLFTRDTSAWIGRGVAVNAMAKPARRRESVHLAAIYDHAAAFAGTPFEHWTAGSDAARRSRAATCSSSAAAACSWAWASRTTLPGWRARHAALRRGRGARGAGHPAARAALVHAPRHAHDHGRRRRGHHLSRPAGRARRLPADTG